MRVDGVPGAPQPLGGSGKGKHSSKAEKYSGEVFIHTRGKNVDFETFIQILNDSMKDKDVRAERVSEIRKLVLSGKYSVDTERLARKMIDAMGGKI